MTERPWRRRLLVFIGFWLATGPVYFVIFHASDWQATVGQRLFNAYVAGDAGKRISFGRSLLRGGAFFTFNLVGIGWISALTIAGSMRRKGLHDFVARTLVLRGRPATLERVGLWRFAAAFGFPTAWLVTTLLLTA